MSKSFTFDYLSLWFLLLGGLWNPPKTFSPSNPTGTSQKGLKLLQTSYKTRQRPLIILLNTNKDNLIYWIASKRLQIPQKTSWKYRRLPLNSMESLKAPWNSMNPPETLADFRWFFWSRRKLPENPWSPLKCLEMSWNPSDTPLSPYRLPLN